MRRNQEAFMTLRHIRPLRKDLFNLASKTTWQAEINSPIKRLATYGSLPLNDKQL